MAQQDTFFDRIKRLFSTNVIVRNIGGRRLKVVDTSQLQAGSKSLRIGTPDCIQLNLVMVDIWGILEN